MSGPLGVSHKSLPSMTAGQIIVANASNIPTAVTLSGDGTLSDAGVLTITNGSHAHDAGDITSGQLALARGGTNADLSATGGTGQVVKQSTVGGAFTVATLSAAEIPTLTLSKISDAGTLALQNANAVAITGGTINGTTIGATTISSSGDVIFGTAGANTARANINAAASGIGLIVRANATTPGNLQEWQNSSGTILSGVDSRGVLFSNGAAGANNVFIGSAAGNVAAGNSNVAIGTNALRSTTGNNNIGIGNSAGYTNTTGANNFFMGLQAGYWKGSGDDNIAIGARAFGLANGAIFNGANGNTIIGSNAGYSLAANATGNVLIGYAAGYSETGSNRLYIANSTTTTPLIYGLFTGAGAGVTIHSQATNGTPLKVKGITSQSSNLQEWQDSSANVLGFVAASGAATFGYLDAGTNDTQTALTIRRNSSGTPAANFASRLLWQLESSTTENQDAAGIVTSWVVATHASRTARQVFNIYDTAAREAMRLEASGSAPMIGFLGAGAAVRQTGGALTAGATYGANEQTMLQRVFDMARTFGLMD